MSFKIPQSAELKVEFQGMEFTLKRPKLAVVLEYQKKAQEAEGKADGQLELLLWYVEQCGCPKDIALELDADQLKAMAEALNDLKKSN